MKYPDSVARHGIAERARLSRIPLGPLDTFFTLPQILVVLLMISVLGSALLIVYTQHLNRSLHIELQHLDDIRDALHVEWSQLLLEQATYGSDLRVERVAQERLHMRVPKQEQMMVIHP